jgi:hypothetical protein
MPYGRFDPHLEAGGGGQRLNLETIVRLLDKILVIVDDVNVVGQF